jgi:uncharacterized membrane protein YedE/YeeE
LEKSLEEFEFLKPLLGGMLIGLASSILLLANGRIAGISGIFEGLLKPRTGEYLWRLLFVVGLMSGGLMMSIVMPERFDLITNRTIAMIGLGGLLVGLGVSVGSGCTSGHGICGISRFSRRSLVAVPTFMFAGAVVVWLINQYMSV